MSPLHAPGLGFKDQCLRVFSLYPPFTWRTDPACGTFDGADVLSLEVVVVPQGAGSLPQHRVLALQNAQGLLKLLLLRRCLLG